MEKRHFLRIPNLIAFLPIKNPPFFSPYMIVKKFIERQNRRNRVGLLLPRNLPSNSNRTPTEYDSLVSNKSITSVERNN